MANAHRDNNRVRVLLLENDGDPTNQSEAEINPVTEKLIMDVLGEGLVVTIGTLVSRDNNRVTVGVAQRTDNGQPMPIHVSPSGRLLIQN